MFTSKTQKQLKSEYLTELSKVFPHATEDSYYRNHYSVFVPFANFGILAIEKPCIQKHFWFGENERGDGDSGPGSMAFAISQCHSVRQKEGFFAHNLRGLDWNEPDECNPLWIGPAYVNYPECRCLCIISDRAATIYKDSNFRMLSLFEHELMRDAYKKVKEDMQKRLNTYWNRYGAKHITAQTYWTER